MEAAAEVMSMTGVLPARRVPPEVLVTFPGAIHGRFSREALRRISYKRLMDGNVVRRIHAFFHDAMSALAGVGLKNLVVGLSGGLDSIVIARLARDALAGSAQVFAVVVNLGRQGEAERVARIGSAARRLGIELIAIDGAGLRAETIATCPADKAFSRMNLDTHLLQMIIFHVADIRDAAVVSTSDKSEMALGRYTECFYGHFAPLADLYKTEVRELAHYLGVDDLVTETRPGCPDYWYDDEVLGADYDVIDPILHLFTARKLAPEQIAREFEFSDLDWLARVQRRIRVQPARTVTKPLILEG
jgi:NAD+ synthase